MGRFQDGRWVEAGASVDEKGRFVRRAAQFRNWVRREPDATFPAVAGRYHLYTSAACPWSHRTLIARKLRGLEDVVSVASADPFMGDDGWRFPDPRGDAKRSTPDVEYLRDVYAAADASYSGRATLPVLWDLESGTIVSNESREIIRMFDRAFADFGEGAHELCPEGWEARIDQVADAIYRPLNNGVYRAGFARTQDAYDEAVTEVFDALDHWEHVLAKQPFAAGDRMTEADLYLFPTLFRFDLVYHYHFKCNRKRLVDYENLWSYTRAIYQRPGVRETCHAREIKTHYYRSHESINPRRVIPAGPDIDFDAPHDRGRFTTP